MTQKHTDAHTETGGIDNCDGISRRDFLNGVAVTVAGAGLLGGCQFAPPVRSAERYPPRESPLTGQQDDAGNALHALRDGRLKAEPDGAQATGEHYDLIVVGAGISGLTTAHLFRQHHGDGARVLLLEAAADFGGHAKRNEFRAPDGRTIIAYGGSQSLQSPSRFSPLVRQVLSDLGVELQRFEREYFDQGWYQRHGLGSAVVFGREQFGRDAVVRQQQRAADWVPQTPLSEAAQRSLIDLLDAPRDYLPALSRQQKRDRLAALSYEHFLLEVCQCDAAVVLLFREASCDYLGVRADSCSALDAFAIGLPGFAGMDLGDEPDPRMSPTARLILQDTDDYIYHFPDGNAAVARALLRRLIPAAVPGASMAELALLPVDYQQLDRSSSPVRLRLNAGVIQLRHAGPVDEASQVDVLYQLHGKQYRVSADSVILACWHRVIPLLTDELSAAQVAALNDQQKVPLIYANVLLRNWQACKQLGAASFSLPGHFWPQFSLDFPVSVAGYRYPESTDQAIVVHFHKIVLAEAAGSSARQQAQLGRHQMAQMSFAELELQLRDALQRALGGSGFDAARDIAAITINRWAHGYSYEYMHNQDSYWPDGELPIYRARQAWGRVAIAGSDSGAYAYAHCAMDQAARAIRELIPDVKLPAFSDFPGPAENGA